MLQSFTAIKLTEPRQLLLSTYMASQSLVAHDREEVRWKTRGEGEKVDGGEMVRERGEEDELPSGG